MSLHMSEKEKNRNRGEIIIYRSEDGLTQINVKLEDETVWLTQQQMAELFQTSKSNVSEHIKNIFDEGELNRDSVVRNFRTTASDGKNYNMFHYNLDMIISLGYRIKSSVATRFRIWTTERLKEYMIKGFTMDDARLKALVEGATGKSFLIYCCLETTISTSLTLSTPNTSFANLELNSRFAKKMNQTC